MARMASGLAARASSGIISGTGLDMARINGSRAIFLIISPVSTPGPDSPMNRSASTMASSMVRSAVSTAYWAFQGLSPSSRPL